MHGDPVHRRGSGLFDGACRPRGRRSRSRARPPVPPRTRTRAGDRDPSAQPRRWHAPRNARRGDPRAETHGGNDRGDLRRLPLGARVRRGRGNLRPGPSAVRSQWDCARGRPEPGSDVRRTRAGLAGFSAANLNTYYKDSDFAPKPTTTQLVDIESNGATGALTGSPPSVETPQPGVLVVRQAPYDVPRIYADTRPEAMWAAGG